MKVIVGSGCEEKGLIGEIGSVVGWFKVREVLLPARRNGGGSDGGGRECKAAVINDVRASCLSSSSFWKLKSRESRSCC